MMCGCLVLASMLAVSGLGCAVPWEPVSFPSIMLRAKSSLPWPIACARAGWIVVIPSSLTGVRYGLGVLGGLLGVSWRVEGALGRARGGGGVDGRSVWWCLVIQSIPRSIAPGRYHLLGNWTILTAGALQDLKTPGTSQPPKRRRNPNKLANKSADRFFAKTGSQSPGSQSQGPNTPSFRLLSCWSHVVTQIMSHFEKKILSLGLYMVPEQERGSAR